MTDSTENQSNPIPLGAWVVGLTLTFVPFYSLYSKTIERQEMAQLSQMYENPINKVRENKRSEDALSRSHNCIVLTKNNEKGEPYLVQSLVEFNGVEITGIDTYDGLTMCAMDGSTAVSQHGYMSLVVSVEPEDLEQYYRTLIGRGRIKLEDIPEVFQEKIKSTDGDFADD